MQKTWSKTIIFWAFLLNSIIDAKIIQINTSFLY